MLTLLSGSASPSSRLGSIVTSSVVPSAFLMDILQPDLVRAIVFERPNWIEEEPDSSAGIWKLLILLVSFAERTETMCKGAF